jgi:addiction module HigA family antidote
MKPHGLSQNRLARGLDLSPARVHDIVHGKSAITANVALRLAKYFGNTPQFWVNLQSEFELRKAQRDVGRSIELRVRALDAAE